MDTSSSASLITLLAIGESKVYVQLILALTLGVLIGLERTLAGKMAGLRTYGLVSMAACLLILTDRAAAGSVATSGLMYDESRMAPGIMTAIGFLCAGLIILRNEHLLGVTSAAGLFMAGAVGIAVGFELYELATFTTFLTLFVFTALWFLEHKLLPPGYSKPGDGPKVG